VARWSGRLFAIIFSIRPEKISDIANTVDPLGVFVDALGGSAVGGQGVEVGGLADDGHVRSLQVRRFTSKTIHPIKGRGLSWAEPQGQR
jgi:hypothetical protein